MAKHTYALLAMLVFLILIYKAFKVRNQKDRIGRAESRLFIASALAIMSYAVSLISNRYDIMVLGECAYYVCIDWMCFTTYLYIMEYTKPREEKHINRNNLVKWLLIILFVADSVSMLLNAKFGHAVKYTGININGDLYFRYNRLFPFMLHKILCYASLGLSMLILLRKVMQSPYIYKAKYSLLFVALTTIVIANALVIKYNKPVDYLVFMYALAALLADYFNFKLIPGYLEKYMQSLTQDKQHDIIVMFDNEEKSIYLNSSAKHILGVKTINREAFDKIWRESEDDSQEVILDKDGQTKYFIKEESDILDKNGKYMGCYYVMNDVTREKELQERYRHLASFDSLTNIYNRQFFFEEAERFMKRNPERKYIIICSDIRQFKGINDIFGVETGDRILRTIADEMVQSDDGDRVYGRVGGDSFAICLPEKNLDSAGYLIKSGSVLHVKNVHYPIVNHIGIYRVDDINMSVSTMCDRAMLAVNSIKEDMQQEIAYFTDGMLDRLLQEQETVKDLLPALSEKQFVIYLQPQINHRNRTIAGAETLVRWNHPEKGMLSPDFFVPLMEKNGLISKLDKCLWRMACELLKKWESQGREMSLSVNISPKDFYYLDLYKELMSLVEEFNITPSKLKLEITESAIVQDVPKQVELIKRLQGQGFIVEMDDFGSGYSSLNTLKDIPVDVLKMDMKFVEKSDNEQRSADILQMVIAMADKLGMSVIAEGVETKERADFLQSIGCDLIQGYYYSEPLTVDEFENILSEYPYEALDKKSGGLI